MQRQLVQDEQLRQQQTASLGPLPPLPAPPTSKPTSKPVLPITKPTPNPKPTLVPVPAQPLATPWAKILPTLHDLLTPARLTRAAESTCTRLSTLLTTFSVVEPSTSAWGDASDVPPEGRLTVLRDMLAMGGEEWWKALVGREGEGVMRVLREWMLGASSGKESPQVAECLVLVLQVRSSLAFSGSFRW